MTTNIPREETAWTIDLTELNQRIDSILSSVNRLTDEVTRRDLTKMYHNLCKIRDDISREGVRCRGLNRTTGNMQRLQKDINDALPTVELMLTLVILEQ